ncbi:MAG TPA: VOC family protein [Tepidisphaeraceae bacterium]|nr:VOC family protein [Tepidisphaeraceae bacterium]
MAVKPIPDGYRSITPYLVVSGAAAAIEFYKDALGARERMRMPGPGGKVMHAELEIGDSVVMLADEFPEMGAKGPGAFGGSPVSIMLYVADVDAIFAKAVGLGAKVLRPVQNQFYGDRSGTMTDPFGHTWTIGTHVEDLTPDEIGRRMAAMPKQECGEKK